MMLEDEVEADHGEAGAGRGVPEEDLGVLVEDLGAPVEAHGVETGARGEPPVPVEVEGRLDEGEVHLDQVEDPLRVVAGHSDEVVGSEVDVGRGVTRVRLTIRMPGRLIIRFRSHKRTRPLTTRMRIGENHGLEWRGPNMGSRRTGRAK